jgi:hypothetical protein
VPARGELETGERVGRNRVGLDSAHIAEGEGGAAFFEQRADARTKLREVGPGDRPADREGDRFRRTGGHQEIDRPATEISSVGRPMNSGTRCGPTTRNRMKGSHDEF